MGLWGWFDIVLSEYCAILSWKTGVYAGVYDGVREMPVFGDRFANRG